MSPPLPLSLALVDRGLANSKRLGPIARVMIHRTSETFPMLHAATAIVREVGQGRDIVAAGGGLTRRRSIGATVGEALERLSLRSPAEEALTVRAFEDPATQIDPRRILAETPYPVAGLSGLRPHDLLFWVAGADLRTRQRREVPAFSVFTRSGPDTPDGKRVYANTSTGAAAARSRDEALLLALYEVIERDAFTAHWENRWSARRTPYPPDAARLAETLEGLGCKVHVRALASDTRVPVAIAAILDPTGRRAAAAFGAAARATWAQAAFRAIEEALLTSMWVTERLRTEGRTVESVARSLAGLPEPSEHAFLYGFPESVPHCAFLFADDDAPAPEFASGPAGEIPDELAWLLERVESVGAHPVFVDITHPAAARLNLTVVRVVVPGFLPLGRGDFRPVGYRRLRDIAENLGLTHLGDTGFNAAPHPFP